MKATRALQTLNKGVVCVLRGYFAESEGLVQSELGVLLHKENLEIFRVSGYFSSFVTYFMNCLD